MQNRVWKSLVLETQFATELVLIGLRKLCGVSTESSGNEMIGSGHWRHAIYLGLYEYSAGLERLAKVAIACHKYRQDDGVFPNLRPYSHRIGTLLKDVAEAVPEDSPFSSHYLEDGKQSENDLDTSLTELIDRFAAGAGRYENLDSLSKVEHFEDSHVMWSKLASKAVVTDEVHVLMGLRDALDNVIEDELIHLNLDGATDLTEGMRFRASESSVGLVLGLFKKVRLVAVLIDVATTMPDENLPHLGEIVGPVFLHSAADFFKYHIVQLGDDYIVREQVTEAYQRILQRDNFDDYGPSGN